jgi:DNA/RNA-binding protein KIN17
MEVSLKEIAKAIKAKGLNKLCYYCQVCEKSCRDANGYKCHLASEAHQRQILVFASNR